MSSSTVDAKMSAKCLVVINAGSSSIKFSLLAGQSSETLNSIAHGEIEGIGTTPHFFAEDDHGQRLTEHRWGTRTSHEDLLGHLIAWIEGHLGPNRLTAAGHRVAHGGFSYINPQLVTPSVLANLRALIPLAPLHQPHNLAPIEALAVRHPGLPQVACFDTAFHATNPRISRIYGLPDALTKDGVWRYGFHGLSYEYISGELPKVEPRAATGRTIVAHLGSGASMCALVGGKSVATTMGFSALDGLLMGTRCGVLDPGAVLYLVKEKDMNAEAIETLLYQQSGLLGVSGISSDMRQLLASSDSRCARRNRPVRLSRRTGDRIAGCCRRRGGRLGIYGWNRRARARGSRPYLRTIRLAWHSAGAGFQPRRRTTNQHTRQFCLSVGDTD